MGNKEYLAEKYYRLYQENYIDEKEALQKLSEEQRDKRVALLAPGSSLEQYKEQVLAECRKDNTCVIAVIWMGILCTKTAIIMTYEWKKLPYSYCL